MANIGKKISDLRREHKITQQELCDNIGVTIACLSRYENGIRHPKVDVLEKIAKFFNVDANYFIDYSNSNMNKFNDNKIKTKEENLAKLIVMLSNSSNELILDVIKYSELLLFKEKLSNVDNKENAES